MKGKNAIMLLLIGLVPVIETTKLSIAKEHEITESIVGINKPVTAQQEPGRLRVEDIGFEFGSDLINEDQKKLLLKKIGLKPVKRFNYLLASRCPGDNQKKNQRTKAIRWLKIVLRTLSTNPSEIKDQAGKCLNLHLLELNGSLYGPS